VGAAVAQRLGEGWIFADADAYHPQANIDKMASGQPLNGPLPHLSSHACGVRVRLVARATLPNKK
jgi:gluconate kinase